MLFFNYQNLYFLASADCQRIVKLLLLHKEHPIKELLGNSYIRNLEPLQSESYSWREKAEYLGILSYRHHPEEMFYRKTWLEVSDMPPWIPLQVLESNPLVTIEGGRILFPYENKSGAS